jgi:sugar phosphate isomerase/epimerase
MNKARQHLNRREFLRQATQTGVLALAVSGPRSLLAAGESQTATRIQIGILLGTFGSGTLETRLDAVRACGLDCVQVSLDCAGLPDMPDEIPLEVSGRLRREAAACGITIAPVQACPQLGTSKIHICTGTRDRGGMWRRHPDNDSPEAWRDMVACVREATEIARRTHAVLAFEPEVNNVVNSAMKARRLLDEIASPYLKVTIDPANLFHTGQLPRMREILDEAFALVGKDIVLAHAKDLDHDGDAGHLAAGQGKLDYDRYLSLLHSYRFQGPLLLHGLSAAQVPGCVAFLRQKLASLPSAPSGN